MKRKDKQYLKTWCLRIFQTEGKHQGTTLNPRQGEEKENHLEAQHSMSEEKILKQDEGIRNLHSEGW